MQQGIRVDSIDMITLIPNLAINDLTNIASTGCLMEYYQNEVLNKQNKIKLNTSCWYHALSRCSGCYMAFYCGTDHQEKIGI